MMSDWVWIRPDIKIRLLPNGQVQGVRTENVQKTLQKTRAIRKETDQRPERAETKDGSNRLIAVHTDTFEIEMQEKCGNDPELRQMFRRDHPELLTVKARDAKIPPKKIFSFPKHLDPGKRRPQT